MNTDFDREPALQPISRDHGVLLVIAQRLRKAAQATVQDRVALATEIQTRHADLVEEYLGDEQIALSKMSPSYLLTNEIAEQHSKINEAIMQLTSRSVESLKPEAFQALANAIEDHVRWDEREVLPYLQRIMSSNQREELSAHTSQLEIKHDRPIKKLHQSIALNKFSGDAQTCTCADSL